jgi:hypothetical protein
MTRFSPLLATIAAVACASSAQLPPLTAARPVGPTPAQALPAPAVGEMAPDFMFTPISASGMGKTQKLSDYRGQTVVLWLFIKARTRG